MEYSNSSDISCTEHPVGHWNSLVVPFLSSSSSPATINCIAFPFSYRIQAVKCGRSEIRIIIAVTTDVEIVRLDCAGNNNITEKMTCPGVDFYRSWWSARLSHLSVCDISEKYFFRGYLESTQSPNKTTHTLCNKHRLTNRMECYSQKIRYPPSYPCDILCVNLAPSMVTNYLSGDTFEPDFITNNRMTPWQLTSI